MSLVTKRIMSVRVVNHFGFRTNVGTARSILEIYRGKSYISTCTETIISLRIMIGMYTVHGAVFPLPIEEGDK